MKKITKVEIISQYKIITCQKSWFCLCRRPPLHQRQLWVHRLEEAPRRLHWAPHLRHTHLRVPRRGYSHRPSSLRRPSPQTHRMQGIIYSNNFNSSLANHSSGHKVPVQQDSQSVNSSQEPAQPLQPVGAQNGQPTVAVVRPQQPPAPKKGLSLTVSKPFDSDFMYFKLLHSILFHFVNTLNIGE